MLLTSYSLFSKHYKSLNKQPNKTKERGVKQIHWFEAKRTSWLVLSFSMVIDLSNKESSVVDFIGIQANHEIYSHSFFIEISFLLFCDLFLCRFSQFSFPPQFFFFFLAFLFLLSWNLLAKSSLILSLFVSVLRFLLFFSLHSFKVFFIFLHSFFFLSSSLVCFSSSNHLSILLSNLLANLLLLIFFSFFSRFLLSFSCPPFHTVHWCFSFFSSLPFPSQPAAKLSLQICSQVLLLALWAHLSVL